MSGTNRVIVTNATSEVSSIMGYNDEIGSLQNLHVPESMIQDTIGIRSCQASFVLQCGQQDRFCSKETSAIKRYASMFKNEPQHSANKAIKIV